MTVNSAAQLDLSALLVPVTGRLLIVPSAVVAEIIKRRELRPPAEPHGWLLGELKWHHMAVPVVAFEGLNNDPVPDPGSGSRLVIMNLPGENGRVHNYAILTQGVPHLLRLTGDDMEEMDSSYLGPAERMRVRVYGQVAAIPDFDLIERHVQSLAGVTAGD